MYWFSFCPRSHAVLVHRHQFAAQVNEYLFNFFRACSLCWRRRVVRRMVCNNHRVPAQSAPMRARMQYMLQLKIVGLMLSSSKWSVWCPSNHIPRTAIIFFDCLRRPDTHAHRTNWWYWTGIVYTVCEYAKFVGDWTHQSIPAECVCSRGDSQSGTERWW